MARHPLQRILLLALIVLIQSEPGYPQEQSSIDQRKTLVEVRDKRRALLMVFRAGVLDASNNERAIVDQVLRSDPEPKGRNRWVYGQIARKLNEYIRKYHSLTAATELSDADYVIYFNVIEVRRILNVYYPYGEMFVITKGSTESQQPRVIWKAKKILWAGDAINDLIKDLKNIRGEG